VGVGLLLGGLALAVQFFGHHTAPYRSATPRLPLDAYAVYFAGFAGCGLVGWAGGLLAAARRPELGRGVGTASAVALVLAALHRMFGWALGEYPLFADLLRPEAAVFLALALAFVLLRPPARAERA
jgi:hypothetical protein